LNITLLIYLEHSSKHLSNYFQIYNEHLSKLTLFYVITRAYSLTTRKLSKDLTTKRKLENPQILGNQTIFYDQF
jgi:Leucine-rich repeat (LRR) protein